MGLRRWEVSLRRYVVLVVVVVCVGTAVSLVLFDTTRRWERERMQTAFEQAAEDRVCALRREIEADLLILQALSRFYVGSHEVERYEFWDFVGPLLSSHPEIQALEWIPRVRHSQRRAYEDAARRERFPHFQITERTEDGERGYLIRALPREEYFPVYFVEPYRGSEAALGFDLASDPTRREALDLSRATGRAVATARIVLVQETGRQFGSLIFLPVYEKGTRVDSLEARRRNLQGFVLGVFRVGDLVENALASLSAAGINVCVSDRSAPPGERFLYHHGSRMWKAHTSPAARHDRSEVGLQRTGALEVAGRKWQVLCKATRAFVAARTTWQPWGILVGGLVVTALVTVYVLKMMSHAAHRQRLAGRIFKTNRELENEIAERRQAEEALRESEEHLRITLASIGDAVIAVDTGRRVMSLNGAAEQLTGWPFEEARGRPLDEVFRIINEETRAPVEDPVAKVIAMGRIEGLANHTVLIARDGAERAIADSAAPIRDAGGQVVGVVLVFRDITEERRVQMELQQRMDELERFNRLAVGREQRMIELKREVNEMARKAGVAPPYDLAFAESGKEAREDA